MPDLTVSPPSPLPKSPPGGSHHTEVAHEEPLPALASPKDGRFLNLPDTLAGRQVCITLYATGDSRDARVKAWRDRQNEVSLSTLGHAAKTLEDAGIDWRGAHTWRRVIKEAQRHTAH